jgi:hypothetical protein
MEAMRVLGGYLEKAREKNLISENSLITKRKGGWKSEEKGRYQYKRCFGVSRQ